MEFKAAGQSRNLVANELDYLDYNVVAKPSWTGMALSPTAFGKKI